MHPNQRLDRIDEHLLQIEERLSRIENASKSLSVSERTADVAELDAGNSVTAGTPLLALAGKSTLILGGAFLLRAATESTALPQQIGVALGLLYATAWIAAAVFAARAGRRSAAVFHCVVAAAVAYPVVWEATTHFGVLSAVTAALLLTGFSIALIFVAHRHGLPLPAWIAAGGATLDALLLAYATKEVIPFLLALTLIGVVALLVSMSHVGWLLATESNLFAVFLIMATMLDSSQAKHSAVVVVALLLFALAWMTVTRRASVQAAVASLIGIAGASALVLSTSTMTILWGFAAVVAAEIGRSTSLRVFALQSAAWGMFAAIGGGLLSFAVAVLVGTDAVVTPVPGLIAAALCLAAFARLDFARVPLLAIATVGVAALTIQAAVTVTSGDAGTHALVRTIVLAATAVGLASIGRRWCMPEASQLAVAMLALTGVKVVAQELRSGSAAVIFIALAVYGSAMLTMARLRRAPTTS